MDQELLPPLSHGTGKVGGGTFTVKLSDVHVALIPLQRAVFVCHYNCVIRTGNAARLQYKMENSVCMFDRRYRNEHRFTDGAKTYMVRFSMS